MTSRQAFAFALATSLVTGACGAGAPPSIAEEIAASPPGTVTVIEFVDYECPFCRELHPILLDAIERRGGGVRVVFKHVPLAGHTRAPGAAKFSICAAKLLGDELRVHDELMRAPSVSTEGLDSITDHLEIDPVALRECVQSDEVASRLEADGRAYDAAGAAGLPLLFIGERKLVGLQSEAEIEAAFSEAL